jgi:hypothetical protein
LADLAGVDACRVSDLGLFVGGEGMLGISSYWQRLEVSFWGMAVILNWDCANGCFLPRFCCCTIIDLDAPRSNHCIVTGGKVLPHDPDANPIPTNR